MLYTSAQAAKLLRSLEKQEETLLSKELASKDFLASINEDVESVRPAYDYQDYQKQLDEIDRKVRVIKHAINVFNSQTIVPKLNMTIDEVLIYIPQLTKKLRKLQPMKNALPKVRENNAYNKGNIIDYRYANYDIEEVLNDYNNVSERLAEVQLALDVVNNTNTFEIDL